MKKIVMALVVLLMAAPAWATVTITCEQVGETNEVIVSFVNDDGEMNVRAFALDITVSAGNILDVNCTNADYWVYPGSIKILPSGEIDEYGDCACDSGDHADTLGGVGTPGVTVEMGSLYEGEAAPAQSGELLRLRTDDGTVTIDENEIRGGIVMEDPEAEVTTNLPSDCEVVTECYGGMADYAEWDAVGKPICWCYPRQCHGDADGLPYGLGGYWVSIPDLGILKDAWNKPAGGLVGNEACADFDHLPYGLGAYRVSIPDLTILKANWNSAATPADCSPGNEEP